VGVVRKSRRGVMLVEKQEWFARLIARGEQLRGMPDRRNQP